MGITHGKKLHKLVEFCVESLFTNIPLDRTIEKLLEKIFNEINRETCNFDGVVFNKESLTKALELCAKDQLFFIQWRHLETN